MNEDIALDVKDPATVAILRDLAELQNRREKSHRMMLVKSALEQLSVLEARGKSSPQTIAQLRASVLRALNS